MPKSQLALVQCCIKFGNKGTCPSLKPVGNQVSLAATSANLKTASETPRHPIILKIAAGLELSTVQKERLMQLADEQRCADQFTKHLTPEFRCLVLRICASALDLDLAAALALHAHLDRLSVHRSHSCDPGTGRAADI